MKRMFYMLVGMVFLSTGCTIAVHDAPNRGLYRSAAVTTTQVAYNSQSDHDAESGYAENRQQYEAMQQQESGGDQGYEQQTYRDDSIPEGQEYEYVEEEEAPLEAPGPDHVWIDSQVVAEGIIIPGFWRPRIRVGFSWSPGFWNGDYWIPGHWKPKKRRRAGYAWVPGHWVNGYWHKGHWRRKLRAGYNWIPGHWSRQGNWIYGHWKPRRTRTNYTWMPGHWNHRGVWVRGKWRPRHRSGYHWVHGRYHHDGRWITGKWNRVRKGRHWEQGYWNRHGKWIPGHWRSQTRHGQHWVQGRWSKYGYWIPGGWRRGVAVKGYKKHGGPPKQKRAIKVMENEQAPPPKQKRGMKMMEQQEPIRKSNQGTYYAPKTKKTYQKKYRGRRINKTVRVEENEDGGKTITHRRVVKDKYGRPIKGRQVKVKRDGDGEVEEVEVKKGRRGHRTTKTKVKVDNRSGEKKEKENKNDDNHEDNRSGEKKPKKVRKSSGQQM